MKCSKSTVLLRQQQKIVIDNIVRVGMHKWIPYNRREASSPNLKLAVAVGSKKIVVMKWRHQEEWYSWNNDTAEGFELLAELHASEMPLCLTLLGPPEPEASVNEKI